MSKLTKKQIEKIQKEFEENPYWQKFRRDGIPRCTICGEKYIKVKPYIWKPNCPHISKRFLLAVG